eukprot:scaffold524_cov390-Prasinococcus_capsulatus_cf.AAC.1
MRTGWAATVAGVRLCRAGDMAGHCPVKSARSRRCAAVADTRGSLGTRGPNPLEWPAWLPAGRYKKAFEWQRPRAAGIGALPVRQQRLVLPAIEPASNRSPRPPQPAAWRQHHSGGAVRAACWWRIAAAGSTGRRARNL